MDGGRSTVTRIAGENSIPMSDVNARDNLGGTPLRDAKANKK
jgi:hypothetical protein